MPSRQPDRCRWTLQIGTDFYAVTPIKSDIHDHAWRLRKHDGKLHHVSFSIRDGPACDCESGVYRPDQPCRHVRALMALGVFKWTYHPSKGI
jgi:hypothetical protein